MKRLKLKALFLAVLLFVLFVGSCAGKQVKEDDSEKFKEVQQHADEATGEMDWKKYQDKEIRTAPVFIYQED